MNSIALRTRIVRTRDEYVMINRVRARGTRVERKGREGRKGEG